MTIDTKSDNIYQSDFMPARAKWSTKHAFLTFFATSYANFVVFAEVGLCVDFCKRKIFCKCVYFGAFSQAIAPKNVKRRRGFVVHPFLWARSNSQPSPITYTKFGYIATLFAKFFEKYF